MAMIGSDYGSVDYDNLVNRAGDVGSIQLAAGQGILPRGAVVTEGGKLVTDAEDKASYILCDDTETDDIDTVTGIVYKNGNFIKNSLIVGTGYELTDDVVASLRSVGIIVEDAV